MLGSAFAEQSGESLAVILRMAENAAAEMNNIAGIIQEQLHVSHAVRESMGKIGDMAQNTVTEMRSSIQAADTLARQSSELKALIEDMRQERREYPRFILETPAQSALTVNGAKIEGKMLDVSRRGARVSLGLQSASSLFTGAAVSFGMVDGPLGALFGNASGKVCWVDGNQFGVELLAHLKASDAELGRMAAVR